MHLLLWQMKNVNCPVFIFKLLHYSSGSLVHLDAAPDSCSPSPPSSWIFQANLILHTETIARMIDLLPDLQGPTSLISILGVSEGREPTVCLRGWWQLSLFFELLKWIQYLPKNSKWNGNFFMNDTAQNLYRLSLGSYSEFNMWSGCEFFL